MLLLPIPGFNDDGISGVQAFKSERFDFFFGRLIGLDKPLDVGRDREPFCFRSLA